MFDFRKFIDPDKAQEFYKRLKDMGFVGVKLFKRGDGISVVEFESQPTVVAKKKEESCHG